MMTTNGDAEHWATNNLEMIELERLATAKKTWTIENYHRGLKQCCGVEKCQARSATAQRNHIAFVMLLDFIFLLLDISFFQLRNF